MSRRLAVLLICLFATFAWTTDHGRATEVTLVTLDGVWWQGLSASEKLAAVQGMIAGYGAGYSMGAVQTVAFAEPSECVRTAKPGTICDDLISKKGSAAFTFATRQNKAGVDRTIGKMVDEIDAAYLNHPRLAKTNVREFVLCAITSGKHCEVIARDADHS